MVRVDVTKSRKLRRGYLAIWNKILNWELDIFSGNIYPFLFSAMIPRNTTIAVLFIREGIRYLDASQAHRIQSYLVGVTRFQMQEAGCSLYCFYFNFSVSRLFSDSM